MGFPRMYKIRQKVAQPTLVDIPRAVAKTIKRLPLEGRIKAGMRVAVTAGSRGIAEIAMITRAVVDTLKELGTSPFIVPAMGSHGGATAEGQARILAHYGITEETMGVPICSSMEVVEVGRMPWGLPVAVDRHAFEADGIVAVNRIKPHTSFGGTFGSGLMKMLVIGLGKHKGASLAHKAAVEIGYQRMIPEIARYLLQRLPLLFGVGILENSRHQVAKVEAVLPEELEAAEGRLFQEAKGLVARIPFDFLHLLIVDEIGKEISGTGMDPNVIGRMYMPGEEEPKNPRYLRILIRDLTAKSGGNAVGMGFADFATRRFADKVDFKVTYTNVLTSFSVIRGKLPIILETDREAIEIALDSIGLTAPEAAKVARIKNTLELEELYASEALLAEVEADPHLEIVGGPRLMAFDDAGGLIE